MSAGLTPPAEVWHVWGEAIPVEVEGEVATGWQATVRQGNVAVCIVGGDTPALAEQNAFVVASSWELYSALHDVSRGAVDGHKIIAVLGKANP